MGHRGCRGYERLLGTSWVLNIRGKGLWLLYECQIYRDYDLAHDKNPGQPGSFRGAARGLSMVHLKLAQCVVFLFWVGELGRLHITFGTPT